jgi:import inner membrane translocase subunit TIM17
MDQRQPCPARIFDDLGTAFAMGAVAGAIFHFCKGLKNAPRNERFKTGISTMRVRAPILGGNFAMWGGLFSTVDCVMSRTRKREGILNSVVAGAVTGGILAFRGGWKACARSAFVGGVFLALIEGFFVNLFNVVLTV